MSEFMYQPLQEPVPDDADVTVDNTVIPRTYI